MRPEIGDIEAEISECYQEAKRLLDKSAQSYRPVADLLEAKRVSERFHTPLVRLSLIIRQSSILGDLDVKAIQLASKRIDAALRFRKYTEWDSTLLYNEDVVMGITHAGFSEDEPMFSNEALAEIEDALDQVSRRIGIVRAEAEAVEDSSAVPSFAPAPLEVRPATAFVMMAIAPDKPELEDVKQAIQEECARFKIRAVRADEIEHSGEITQRILDEIRTSEFLIADLTGERPSVYYEVGFAHAIGKRPILYRRAGTRLHFDLSVHNCPEYKNITELREMLRRRLTAMTRGE